MPTTFADSAEADMDNMWGQFLKNKVNSFIKWDLVRFFHDNPYTAETADNIAGFIARDAKTVHRELDELVHSGIVAVQEVGGYQIYRFSDADEVRQLIAQFMTACKERAFRVRAINTVIQGMHFTPRHDF